LLIGVLEELLFLGELATPITTTFQKVLEKNRDKRGVIQKTKKRQRKEGAEKKRRGRRKKREKRRRNRGGRDIPLVSRLTAMFSSTRTNLPYQRL
jgi:hypothetical protein